MNNNIYEQMVKDAGIPTTEEAMKQKWEELNQAEGMLINNDSAWSAFWRLITAIVTRPAVWFVTLLINYQLPNAFLKTATSIWLDMLAWAVNVTRKPATKTLGNILFTKEDAATEVTIEKGVLIATPAINGKVYRVITTEETVMAPGILSRSIPVIAEVAGTSFNLGPGYYSVLPEPVDGIAAVTNESDWITTEGADEEKDEALRLRCQNQFSAVGQYHHDSAYRADITLFAGIQANYVVFEHGAPRGPGSANAFIMIDSGAPSQELVDSVNDYIISKGNHGHGDDMRCFAMPITAKALTVTVYHESYLTEESKTDLEAEVKNIIRYAFRDNQNYEGVTRTMPFERFSFSKLSEELHERLPELRSVVFSLPDIITEMEITKLSNLTVTLAAE